MIRTLAFALLLLATPAVARTLQVGQGKPYALPSEASAAAQDGDTVLIDDGDYFDCAIVRSAGLTIAGAGTAAALTDKTCEQKALLVIRTAGVTIRNLALRRARVPDGNGAGLRLEGPGVTVDNVRFENDEVGILSGVEGGAITVTGSRFERGGVGGEQPKFAIMTGRSDLLRITGSTFAGVKGGQIATAARWSAIAGNTIGSGAGDGSPDDLPAAAIVATDGDLLLDDNVITIGPSAPRDDAAVAIWDGATATLRGNRLVNQTGKPLTLLLDWSWSSPKLDGNQIGPGDRLVGSSGAWRHRAVSQYYALKASAHAFVDSMKPFVKRMLGR